MLDVKAITEICLSFQEALEKPHFEKASFRVRKKIFATLDTSKKTLVVKLNEVDQSVFSDIGDENVYPVPGGWGRQGWTILEYEKLDRNLVEDAITISYCNVAPKSLGSLYKD